MVRTIVSVVAILSVFTSGGVAAQKTVRAALQLPRERKIAPAFLLTDKSGKLVSSSSFRGKVALIDFWATECGGCIAEIPFFVEFAEAYKAKGLAVVGVSLDVMYEGLKDADDGWRHVTPFVKQHRVNYTILMGNDEVSRIYDIQQMPATYLIDKQGRIAALYIGVVNKADVETNIRKLLAE